MKTRGTQGDNTSAGTKSQVTEYLSMRQAAKVLRIGRDTLRDILPDIPGAIRLSPKTVRIPRAGLDAYAAKTAASLQ